MSSHSSKEKIQVVVKYRNSSNFCLMGAKNQAIMRIYLILARIAIIKLSKVADENVEKRQWLSCTGGNVYL